MCLFPSSHMETQSLTFHGFCPAGFESHHDVQAGLEHLLFLPQPPIRWQFRVHTAPAWCLPLWTSHRPSWAFLRRTKTAKQNRQNTHIQDYQTVQSLLINNREKSCLKMWIYTHKTVMISPIWNQTWFLLLSYLVFVQKNLSKSEPEFR